MNDVVISVVRNGLGQVAYTDDSVMGMVLTGVAVVGKIQLDSPQVIYALEEAEALGITEAGNAPAHKQIKEFYAEAGSGMKLYVILTDDALMSSQVNGASSAAAALLNYAQGAICLLGLSEGTTQSAVIANGLNEDVILALTNAQALAESYEGKIMPLSIVMPGIDFTGVAADALDLKTLSRHRCSVVLAATEDDEVAAVGQLLGRLAAGPVQRKASRVRSGALSNLEGYLTDGELVDDREGDIATLAGKGYICYRKFPTKTGYFFSGDPTATAATDDLNTIARNRIIDKAIKIAYNTYVDEIDEDVLITDQGYLDPGVVGTLKANIETQARANMRGEISNFVAVINPAQNILSGAAFEVELQITPKGYLGPINVSIGFTNPFNT